MNTMLFFLSALFNFIIFTETTLLSTNLSYHVNPQTDQSDIGQLSHHRSLQGIELKLHLEESSNYVKDEKYRYISTSCFVKFKQPYNNLDEKYLSEILNLNVRYGMTMASDKRQRATAMIAREALYSPYNGDFVETGVYTGGTSAIIMRILMDFDACSRKFYAFDSFAGLPGSQPEDRAGSGMKGNKGQFVATQERYENNLKRVGAWNDSIIVISKGWFNDTCRRSPVKRISFLRLDGDIFVSTWDALTTLYDRVVPGGYVYVDDYGSFNGCREAVDRFRTQQRIYEPLRFIREDPGSITARTNSFGKMLFEAVWWQKRLVVKSKRKKGSISSSSISSSTSSTSNSGR